MVDRENGKMVFSFIAALFLPFATVMYVCFLKLLSKSTHRLFFLFITMSAIAPVILLGTAYYPRFELVNVVVAVVTFLLLYANPLNGRSNFTA